MANTNKGFSDAAVKGYPPQGYAPPPQGYAPPPQGYPPQRVTSPYVTQQQPYGGAPPHVMHNQYGGPVQIVTAQPVRETGTPPDTACSFIFAILSIFLCLSGWPFAVVAIVFNRKAKAQVDLGQYTAAKGYMKTCFIFIGITVVLGIIGWVIFGIRLKAALDIINDNDDRYRYYG